jgi:hypothetical protein
LVDVRQAASAAATQKCGLSTPDLTLSGGRAMVACQVDPKFNVLQFCEIKDETVPGLGARAVQFMDEQPPTAALPAGKPIYANVCLDTAPSTPAVATDIDADWAAPVKPPVMPAKALKANQHGYAKVRCSIDAKGALSDCTALTDLPAGFGFADAAIKSLAGAKLKPPSGKFPDGATIAIPFYFNLAPFIAP